MKLGKKPATLPRVHRMRDLIWGAEHARPMPPVPAAMDWSQHVASWPMLDNDTIGDCTIASVGHAVQCWCAAVGTQRAMTNAEAIAGYETFGYVPGDEGTDQGANLQDVLTRWTAPGFGVGGYKDVLAGFCTLDPRDDFEVKAGVAWLGAVSAGIALPLGVQGADSWDVGPLGDAPTAGPWAPGSWGGHAVPIVGYGPWGLLVVTWGKTLRMTWPFWRTYADEAFGLLSRDFANNVVPAEAWTQLEQDMADLRGAVK